MREAAPVNLAEVVASPSSVDAGGTPAGEVLIDPSLRTGWGGGGSGAPEVRLAEPAVSSPASRAEKPAAGRLAERIRDREPARFAEGWAAKGLRFDVASEVVHDDNIYYSRPGEEVSDVVLRFRPGIYFEAGDALEREGAFGSMSYRPQASVFIDNDGESTVDHDVALAFGGSQDRVKTSADIAFRTLSEPSVDVSERADRSELEAALEFEYDLTGKTGLRADAQYFRSDYDRFAGSDEWRAGLYATYSLGAKTELGIGYGYGELRPDAAVGEDYQRALVRADWEASAKLAAAAWGGADFRERDAADETSAVFGIELASQLREGTKLRLSAGRDIEASALLDSETYTLAKYSAAVEQRVGDRFTAVLEGGYEDYRYSGGGEFSDSDRSDTGVFVRPALRYGLRDDLRAEVFYAFRDNDSSVDLLDFENNQFGASVRYEF